MRNKTMMMISCAFVTYRLKLFSTHRFMCTATVKKMFYVSESATAKNAIFWLHTRPDQQKRTFF